MSLTKITNYLAKPITTPANTQIWHPILLSDSKAYSIKNNNTGLFPLEPWAESGANLENRVTYLERRLPRALETHNRLVIYLWAGTCDLTIKPERSSKKIVVADFNDGFYVEFFAQIKRAFTLAKRYPGRVQLKLVDLQPVSIIEWNKTYRITTHNPEATAKDDRNITEAVQKINRRLREIAIEEGSSLVYFSKFINKSRGRGRARQSRYSINVNLLSDGVHPGPQLSKAFVRVLQEDINKTCYEHTSEEDILRIDPNSSEADEFD